MTGFTEELRSSVEVDARPEDVWTVLTDFDAFPSWNPFVVSIDGELAEGSRLRVRLEPPGGRGISLKPTVTVLEPPRTFGWLGRLIVPGLFDGAHRFDLQALPDGRTLFTQSEHFKGLLVPLFRRSLRTHTLAGFETMNRALADRVPAQT